MGSYYPREQNKASYISGEQMRRGEPMVLSTLREQNKPSYKSGEQMGRGGTRGPCTQDNRCEGEEGIFVPRRTTGRSMPCSGRQYVKGS
jgi:hypothetical protein